MSKTRGPRDSDLRRTTGFTLDLYEQKFREQGGVCALCGAPPRKVSLNADHHHGTGTPRGLLCPRCNQNVGWAEGVWDKLGKYLAGPLTGPSDPSRYGGIKRPTIQELRKRFACPGCGAVFRSDQMTRYYYNKGRKPTMCRICARESISKSMKGNTNARGASNSGKNQQEPNWPENNRSSPAVLVLNTRNP